MGAGIEVDVTVTEPIDPAVDVYAIEYEWQNVEGVQILAPADQPPPRLVARVYRMGERDG